MKTLVASIVAPIGLALVLGGCALQPLYGERTSADGTTANVATELNAIHVGRVRDRVGIELRNSLIDMLTPSGEPASPQYDLNIDIRERRSGLAVQQDATATRYNYVLAADYSLRDRKNGTVLFRDSASSVVAYNVLTSQYATISAAKDAEDRAARAIANDIRLRLSIYFQGNPAEDAVSEAVSGAGEPVPSPSPL